MYTPTHTSDRMEGGRGRGERRGRERERERERDRERERERERETERQRAGNSEREGDRENSHSHHPINTYCISSPSTLWIHGLRSAHLMATADPSDRVEPTVNNIK